MPGIACHPKIVICLSILDGRDTVWVEGNHDQSFVPPGHTGQIGFAEKGIIMRHIMDAAETRP